MLSYNRWYPLKGLAAILCIAVIVWLSLAYFIPAPPTKIIIGTGFKGGSYEFYGQKYQEILARAHVALEVRQTEASGQNLKLLQDPNSGVQVAFVQGGVSNSKLAPGLVSLGRVNYQLFAVFYRASEQFDDLTQLKGKRIAVGPVGSGTQVVAAKVLGISGITSETATLLPIAGQSAVDALKDGKVDVLFVANVPDAPLVQALIKDSRFKLMSFSRATALTRIFPFLVKLELAQGVIDFEKNNPATDVTLLGATNAVLVREDLHPQIIGLLTQTLLEAHSEAGIFQRYGEFPTQTDPEYPMAPSARDFYKNGPSFLNRYLPFWITNYVERGIAVLVTAIAIVVPVFSYSPKLYRGLVEYRLRSAYRRLRKIETSLQKDISETEAATLETEIEGLDRSIHNLGVPMQHSDLYFTLKTHVDLVRARLVSRRDELLKLASKGA
jgi:TRAP transporter TAXI family solute receptor